MRHLITSFFILFSTFAVGQSNDRFSLVLQLQPELTFHKNDYAFRWKEKKTLSTFNIGLNASLQYKLTERFSLDFGLGFISRKLNAKVFVNQSLLPPPFYDSTKILYTTKSVSFRTLQIPLGLTYSFIKTKNSNIFIRGAYMPNFLLNTKYEVNNYPGFKKNIWQGYSLNLGLGFDYYINDKIKLTNCLSYSFANTVAKDDYTFSQDEKRIAMTHTFIQLSTGVKIKL
jgi:long-subunit fatty acid transport protein